MLKKGIYLFFLLGVLATVGCTKEPLIEPSNNSNTKARTNSDQTLDYNFYITDDVDDEGDAERKHPSR